MKKISNWAAFVLSLALLFTSTACAAAYPEAAAPEADERQDVMEYISPDGWRVLYDPELMEGHELEDGGAFVYIGESAGTNMVEIRKIEEKGPQEVLGEVTEGWGDPEAIFRSEGIFPGTNDKWGYWRVLNAPEEGSGLSRTAIAGEYNGGTLLFDITAHVGGEDEERSIAVSDAIAELINSITYVDGFEPQEMYAYYPGVYTRIEEDELDGQKLTAEYSVTLNEDHTGTISIQDDVDVLWGSTELIRQDGSDRYEYDIEGNFLYLNEDGNWIEFVKKVTPETYAGTWAEMTSERVVIMVDPAEEENWFDVTVTWREDLPQKDLYTMKAHYQEDGSLYYEDCTYVIRTFNSDGTFSDELQYENGAGLLNYQPDEDILYWTDYELDPQENVQEFIRNDDLRIEPEK